MLDSVYLLLKVAKYVCYCYVPWTVNELMNLFNCCLVKVMITKADCLLCLVEVVMFFPTAVEITIVCTLKEL